ncbi:hypothetical protein B0H11DRAFT_359931 [Mycena galericulata]|nr:hypothetical protein B0H11DRAFT_359931 [Mycena galericulata]
MPASPALKHPWPERTAPSSPWLGGVPSTSKLVRRQIVADQDAVAAAKTQCEQQSGNEVISCFPTADVVIPQHQWATFVWNSNDPDFVQSERVDVYLFHGDSLEEILFMPDQINPIGRAGSVTAQVNDSWWGDRGANWAGSNISYPFYWLIQRNGESLTDGTQQPQTTFSAVQTTFADSILSSMSSSSASASAAAALRTRTSSSASTTSTSTARPDGQIQSSGGSAPFPHWAIIVIVLGIVAVLALCGCMLFAIYYIRERDARQDQDRDRHHHIPVRESSPGLDMAEAAGGATIAGGALALGRDTSGTSQGHGRPSTQGPQRTTSPAQRTISPDSTISRTEPVPFSGADAAVMAAAFRTGLRSPGRRLSSSSEVDEDEGEGTVDGGGASRTRSPDGERERERLLRRDLGDEGTDIRSVESARTPLVESSEGHGTTNPNARLGPRRDLSL